LYWSVTGASNAVKRVPVIWTFPGAAVWGSDVVPVSATGVQVEGDDGARVPVIAAWAGMLAQQAKNHSGALRREVVCFFIGFCGSGLDAG
jgi:hypothetical protein